MSTCSCNPSLDEIASRYSQGLDKIRSNIEKDASRKRYAKKTKERQDAEKIQQAIESKRSVMKLHYGALTVEEKKALARKNNLRASERLANCPDHLKKLHRDRVNKRRRKNYAQRQAAIRHNKKFPFDKLAETQREMAAKERKKIFGKETTVYVRVPKRVVDMEKHLSFVHDGLGHCGEGGHFVETTAISLLRVAMAVDKALFNGDPRNRHLVTLDAGSGNGFPSIVWSQYLFDLGFHVGVELCPGLVSNAMKNLKEMTTKGTLNLLGKSFDQENVEKHGELNYNVPPRCMFIQGDLEDIEHFGGIDLIYGFDAVNSDATKIAMAKAWNHPKSHKCMVVVSNSNLSQMKDLGYEDIDLVDMVSVAFRTSGNESRPAHVYRRKKLRKDKAAYSHLSQDWKQEGVAESCPMLAKAFELYRKGDENARETFTGYKINTMLIDANMGVDPCAILPKPQERRKRSGLPAAVNVSAEDNASLSIITMDS